VAKPEPASISPLKGALTVGLSFFVGLMSLLLAVMAFAVAGRQDNPHPDSLLGWNDAQAMRMSYVVGVLSLVNSYVSFAKARLRPWITAGCVSVFIITTILTNALFVRAW
jgi:hypothetical protein